MSATYGYRQHKLSLISEVDKMSGHRFRVRGKRVKWDMLGGLLHPEHCKYMNALSKRERLKQDC